MNASRYVAGMLVVSLLIVTSAAAVSGPTLVGFHETYVAPDGSECTHRGVDVGMPAGAEVGAPVSGHVRFAGRVPGPHGGSILALSLETPSGIVTMLPFEDVALSTGESVTEGEVVGHVAAQGDPSVEAAHLHLGLKRGSLYVDPSFMIAAIAPSAAPKPEAEPVTASAAAPLPVPAPVLAAAPVPAPAVPGSTAPATVFNSAPVASSACESGQATRVQVYSRSQATPDAAPEVRSTSESARTASQTYAHAMGPIESAGASRGVTAAAQTRLGASGLRMQQGALGYGFALFGAAIFGSALVLTRKSLAGSIVDGSHVSDRLGILLQHLKAGDTLCGLTSCSGHAAFTVPGPSAQRR